METELPKPEREGGVINGRPREKNGSETHPNLTVNPPLRQRGHSAQLKTKLKPDGGDAGL